MSTSSNEQILQCTTAIVVAQITTTGTPTAEVAQFLRSIYSTLRELEGGGAPGPIDAEGISPESISTDQTSEGQISDEVVPAVPVEQSVTYERVICLEDGKPLRMLKRYLMAKYGMSPEQYRQKWGLPDDYPMVAPELAEQRRAAARKSGLGKKEKSSKRRTAPRRAR